MDCGLYQGLKYLRLRNWDKLPVDPARIDAVALTHAHIDHIGYLPRLVKDGFGGPVTATRGTEDLARILLPDSGHLQEEEAAYHNRRGTSKHTPALPLYTAEEGARAAETVKGVDYRKPTRLLPGLQATFRRAGHILGSSSVHLELQAGTPLPAPRLLGRHRPLRGPDPPRPGADRRGRLHLRRVDLRRPAARPDADSRSSSSASSGRRWTGAARSSCRPSRSAGRRS